jgi:hypothetical protein
MGKNSMFFAKPENRVWYISGMSNTEIDEQAQLSKWWKTPSAQAAMKRAEENKRMRIEVMKQQFAERKAKLDKEIWGEEVA